MFIILVMRLLLLEKNSNKWEEIMSREDIQNLKKKEFFKVIEYLK